MWNSHEYAFPHILNLSLKKEGDLILTWDSPVAKTDAKIYLKLNIDQHGASPITLFCTFDDTGSGNVPANLIKSMMSAGISGYPNGTISRKTVDSMNVEKGCVEFEVAMPQTLSVSVEGKVPCKDDTVCPEGLHCNKQIEICE